MIERLQKYISGAGVASRRRAEELILQGLVKVNGKVVRELGVKVDSEHDVVMVEGKKIAKQKFFYLMMNKPKRYITTRHDPKGRKTVFDLIPANLRNVVWPVGRLDYNTEGLLIMTNDGELTQLLTHPSKEHEKEYMVELDREISEGKLEKIRTGVLLDERKTSPAQATAAGKIIRMIIREGWNRQIRRMFAVIGLSVQHLKRVRVGKLRIKDLQLGEYREISKKDIV